MNGRHPAVLDRLDSWSRLACLGLTLVLIVSASFTFAAAAATARVSDAAQSASDVNEFFRDARFAVAAEESLERKYRLEPSAAVLAAHRASAKALVTALGTVRARGDAGDGAIASDVLHAHRTYLGATLLMFRAVDRNDQEAVIAIDHGIVDPVFGHIEKLVDGRARTQDEHARLSLVRLRETQRGVVNVTVVLSVLGIVSLAIFLGVLQRYKQRLGTAHRAELRALEEAALVDQLTGIGNHRAYKDAFQREVSRAKRHHEPLSVALIDIDDFKVINDRDGHRHGDRMLVELASRLKSLRIEDGTYRVGGDEFAVILPHTAAAEAKESMERLRVRAQSALLGGTVSIGLATSEGANCSVETLQAQADAALYATQRSGRNCVTAFDGALDDMRALSTTKIDRLRRLIVERAVRIVLQPIWDIDRCNVLGYEALSRFDPLYGFAGPQEAFDLAERVGRAHELDALCREATLSRAPELPPDALLFLNVSPQSLDRGRLDAGAFAEQVRAVGLTPAQVVVEITERSISQVDAVIGAARELQSHGFRLALDDTGAGNSGLEILSHLPFEFVKIDRDVTVKALEEKNARAVMAGIVAIAQATNAYVIAEGIETTEVLRFVCEVGMQTGTLRRSIQGVQGYLLVRPGDTFVQSPQTARVEALLRDVALEAMPARSAAEHCVPLP